MHKYLVINMHKNLGINIAGGITDGIQLYTMQFWY